jgi:hypothetical protein
MSTWTPAQTAFVSYEEVAGPRGRSRSVRRIIEGQGKLTPERDFTWRGNVYRAGITRVAPDADVARSEFAHLLTPAFAKEDGPPVIDFLERVRGRKEQCRPSILPQRNSAKSPHDYWRLGPPRWRLG